MNSISDISKKDAYWRQVAYRMTGDSFTADELVQDMYMKLMNIEKDINDYYVVRTIRGLFLDGKRKKKRVVYGDVKDDVQEQPYELDDNENRILERVNDLKFWEIELLDMSQHYSLRELENIYNINYMFIYRTLNRIKKTVNGEKENT